MPEFCAARSGQEGLSARLKVSAIISGLRAATVTGAKPRASTVSGWRCATADEIEAEGVRRALARANSADLKLVLFDATLWPAADAATATQIDDNTLILLTKSDMATGLPKDLQVMGQPALAVSVKTGAGTEAMLARLRELIAERCSAGELPALTRRRHREALGECQEALKRVDGAASPELMAEDLRLAARALGRITGRVDVEDILDRIFRDFCIGK